MTSSDNKPFGNERKPQNDPVWVSRRCYSNRNLKSRSCCMCSSVLVLCCSVAVLLQCIGSASGQFRTDQDPELYRYKDQSRAAAGWSPYTTPAPGIGSYRSGDTYHGTNRRYGNYDRGPNEKKGFDGIYEQENRYTDHLRYGGDSRYLTQGRFDSRGRLRPGYEDRNYQLDNRKDQQIGVLDHWRPDLQGEQRPGKIPGIHLPLAENLFVTSNSGKIQGFYVYLYDKPDTRFDERPVNLAVELQRLVMNVSVFLGIPYAKPPVNEGRFKPPRRVQNWYSTWQALDFRPACPQNLKYVGSSNGIRNGVHEDCLYLNIYTPTVAINVRDPYPVMFHIHGGDFEHGASNLFPGHMLAGWGEVVVVTINYRLGALGFLSTGDENSPGNYGLLDMSMALEWIYNNIRLFNGDREQITVFGPGAGGAAAGLLAVLPKTRSYVRQFISSSGSPLADWAAIDDIYRVQNTSRVYGLQVGCSVESSHKLLQCLNRRNYEELASAPIKPDVGTFAWSPVVDRNFSVPRDDWYEDWEEDDWRAIPENPIKMFWANLHHPQLRAMAGCNRDEAANMVAEDPRLTRTNTEVTEEFFDLRIKEWVKQYNYSLNPEGAYDAIKWMYTFWPDPHNTTHIREQYVNMLSDALYKSGIDQLVKELVNSTDRQSVPTYYYMLNTTLDALKLPYWREVPGNIEYYFLSGAPFMDPDFYPENFRISRNQFSEGDRNISQFMMKTFANFAKWGNPTQVQVSVLKAKWEPVLEGTLRYLAINNTFNTTMHYNLRQPQNTFWYYYIPLVVREWIPTPRPPRNPWVDMTEPVTAAMYSFVAITVALLVVLCVCLGLWKSANRQRNKALDDLQFYSTDNLAEEQENYDEGVRKYLERLPSSHKSNGTLEMTRSTTPVTIMTNAADTTIQGASRPTTPNGGVSTSVSNGRITGLSESDACSHVSQRSSYKQGGSPYSSRKAYSGDNSDSQPLRPSTPSSIVQYSDGVYIGTTHSNGRTPTDALDRSPKMRQKHITQRSQPAVNHGFDRGNEYSTLPTQQYQPDTKSVPNVAYNLTQKSSSSSDGSTRSTQPLQLHSAAQIVQYQQPNANNGLVSQPQMSLQQQPSQGIYQTQPIQQPLIQTQQLLYQQQHPQHVAGIPLQQYPPSQTPVFEAQYDSHPQQFNHDYATLPHSRPNVDSNQMQMAQQNYDQLQIQQQQHQQQPLPTNQEPLLSNREPFLTNHQPLLTNQQPTHGQQTSVTTAQPQPMPRSSVPSSEPTVHPIASRSTTPSSLTFEISMKNSRTTHTVPAKVMNTEL